MKLSLHEAKTHLFRYLERIEQSGEVIVLCRRNVPIAEIRALPKGEKGPRPIGLAKGEFKVGSEFFDELPEELLNDFESGT